MIPDDSSLAILSEIRDAIACNPNLPTLRDRFAMAALTGLLAGRRNEPRADIIEAMVMDSYALADAMLKERMEKGVPT